MKHGRYSPKCCFPALLSLLLLLILIASPVYASKPRLLVLTDIGNEPDDAQSLVRLLVYSNEFDIEGIVATTSNWLQNRVLPEMIRERIEAYGQVRENLLKHASGYPPAAGLLAKVKSGRPEFGLGGVGEGKDTEASEWIIRTVDLPDPRPLWITVWGGAVDLAQALSKVRRTRTPEQLRAFIDKLRVYTISDQDNTGPWMRREFPELFYICSIHAYSRYATATWAGISGDRWYEFRGPDFSLVSNDWLDRNVRENHGPLGKLYPRTEYIMEGDTPSFLYLIPNGLGISERPEWGSWGGRYEPVYPGARHYADTVDGVIGADGLRYVSNHATVWRWREAYQNDFAARMDWTVTAERAKANHRPVAILNAVEGLEPIYINARPGQQVELSAEGSSDPDGDTIAFQWFQYREAGGRGSPEILLDGARTAKVTFTAPRVRAPAEVHVVLSVSDDGQPRLYAYRRAVITIYPE